MKTIVMVLITLFIGILGGCSHDKAILGTFDKTGYPLNVGNWWQYKVRDSIHHTTDTLLLKITHKMSNGDSVTYRCDLERRSIVVDSAFITASASALSYKSLGSGSPFFGEFKLKLPFHSGEAWNGSITADSFRVISHVADYNVLGKKYDVYSIKRSIGTFGYHVTLRNVK
jgi:hypothetical protein